MYDINFATLNIDVDDKVAQAVIGMFMQKMSNRIDFIHLENDQNRYDENKYKTSNTFGDNTFGVDDDTDHDINHRRAAAKYSDGDSRGRGRGRGRGRP
jgi:hypothetical protein